MIHELRASIIFFEDVNNLERKLLITRGQDVNELITKRLINYASTSSVKEPIKVIAPLD
jgi:bacterioferritin (cytochrome b1)